VSGARKTVRDVRELVRRHLVEMPGYEPVEPIDVIARRLGIPEDQVVKLDGNENPYGPSPMVAKALAELKYYHVYPDPAQTRVREAVAKYVCADAEQIVLGSGSDELLNLTAMLFLSPGDVLVNAPPTFGMYDFLGYIYDARVVIVPRREDFTLDLPALEEALDDAKLLYLASPNNPTGNSMARNDLERLLDRGAVIVVDEAYAEFAGDSFVDMVGRHDNLIVVRTFSKWAGLAGLRAGYGVFPKALTEIIWKAKVPYNLSVAAETAILASLEDAETLRRNVELIIAERERLAEGLRELPWLRPYPAEGNFVLCEVRGLRAKEIRDRLREMGIMIRYFDSAGLRNCLRISVGKPDDTDRLLVALRGVGAAVGK
jgi:histidinol-phosphate aminotransferase